MAKLQFDSNKQFKITLPKQILTAKGWKKGDDIIILLDDAGNLVLKKALEASIKKTGISQKMSGKKGGRAS